MEMHLKFDNYGFNVKLQNHLNRTIAEMKISKATNNRGFGLNQLIVAIFVIGVLANVFEPQIATFSGKTEAKAAQVKSDAQAFFKPVFLVTRD